MIINGWQKTSFIDFPRGICSTLFLAGCNFRCPYCHNPELVMGSPNLPSYDVTQLRTELSRRTRFLDGVCISGGEPTLHQDLEDLLHSIKEIGLRVKLDTNGSKPDHLRRLLRHNLVDYVAMDIKAPLFKYKNVTGVTVDVGAIEESASLLRSSNIEYEFRTTVSPNLLTSDDIESIGRWLSGSTRYALQSCRSGTHLDPSFSVGMPADTNWLHNLRELLLPYFTSVTLRGAG